MESPNFKVGDLVTGKDRHYKRSIYKLVEVIDDKIGKFEFMALNGNTQEYLISTGQYKQHQMFSERYYNEFRHATPLEVKFASTKSHLSLIAFLYKLGIQG